MLNRRVAVIKLLHPHKVKNTIVQLLHAHQVINIIPESEILAKILSDTGEKLPEDLAKFCPSKFLGKWPQQIS